MHSGERGLTWGAVRESLRGMDCSERVIGVDTPPPSRPPCLLRLHHLLLPCLLVPSCCRRLLSSPSTLPFHSAVSSPLLLRRLSLCLRAQQEEPGSQSHRTTVGEGELQRERVDPSPTPAGSLASSYASAPSSHAVVLAILPVESSSMTASTGSGRPRSTRLLLPRQLMESPHASTTLDCTRPCFPPSRRRGPPHAATNVIFAAVEAQLRPGDPAGVGIEGDESGRIQATDACSLLPWTSPRPATTSIQLVADDDGQLPGAPGGEAQMARAAGEIPPPCVAASPRPPVVQEEPACLLWEEEMAGGGANMTLGG